MALRMLDEFLEDEVIISLKHPSYRLHVSALIYCAKNLTNGEVTDRAVKVIQAILGFSVKRAVGELVEVGLWEETEGGYRIRNYLEFNPDAATVKAEKSRARDRMRKLREKRAGLKNKECDDERSGEQAEERAEHVTVQPRSVPNQAFEVQEEPGRQFVGRSLPFENEILCAKLLQRIGGHADDGTATVVRSYAAQLPPAALTKVIESLEQNNPSNRARYAVGALKNEIADRKAA